MKFIKTDLKDLTVIEPQVFGDERGFFLESYHQEKFQNAGIKTNFIQDNHSRSSIDILRGLHLQLPPHAQAKLVRCTQGEIFDVAIDLRRDSPTFKNLFSITLSSENKRMLFIPQGFAHGLYVTSEIAEVVYKCDALYAPESEVSIKFDDPDLAIDWPGKTPSLSKKDGEGMSLNDYLNRYENLEWKN